MKESTLDDEEKDTEIQNIDHEAVSKKWYHSINYISRVWESGFDESPLLSF